MISRLCALVIVCFILPTGAFSWNAFGHRLVAQIAYDNMTSHARAVFDGYNHALDKVYKPQNWNDAAVWLDTLRYQDIHWYAALHYVDIPFSDDGSSLPIPQENNALWGIAKAVQVITNKYATPFDKGIALRILMHVVGDLHQPLHAATKVSSQLPRGDRGGNLVALEHNSVAPNLHAYWDRGAGLFLGKKRNMQLALEKKAAKIEQQWPCKDMSTDISPLEWAKESHVLAVEAYKPLKNGYSPNKQYQQVAKKVVVHQVALAGCRLAMLLNQIAATTY